MTDHGCKRREISFDVSIWKRTGCFGCPSPIGATVDTKMQRPMRGKGKKQRLIMAWMAGIVEARKCYDG